MQIMALTLSTIMENNGILDLGTSNFCLRELSHYETQCKKKAGVLSGELESFQ